MFRKWICRYLIALIALALATLLRQALAPLLGNRFPLVIYNTAVAVAAWYGGLGPASFSLIAGFLIADYCFIEPRRELFYDTSLEYRVGGILYFINSLTEIALVFVLRKAATKAATSVEVIKNVSDSIIVINQKGIVQSFNPAAENLFGYPAVEVV